MLIVWKSVRVRLGNVDNSIHNVYLCCCCLWIDALRAEPVVSIVFIDV